MKIEIHNNRKRADLIIIKATSKEDDEKLNSFLGCLPFGFRQRPTHSIYNTEWERGWHFPADFKAELIEYAKKEHHEIEVY